MDSTEVRRRWAERSGEFSPAYYAYYGPDGTSEAIRRLLECHVDRDASVLELGCSSGRHLAHLLEHGFENLTGIEVNDDAFDVMAEAYPDLAARGTFYHDAIEDVVRDFDDGQFDAVYSVETLQHIHPDAAWIFAELSRIAGRVLVTVENEGDRGDVGDGEGAGENEGDRGGVGDGEGAGESADETVAENAADRSRPPEPDVSYVNGDFPLYHRNWNRVFTELGLVEVDVDSGGRDTIRAFRSVQE